MHCTDIECVIKKYKEMCFRRYLILEIRGLQLVLQKSYVESGFKVPHCPTDLQRVILLDVSLIIVNSLTKTCICRNEFLAIARARDRRTFA